MRRSRPGAFDPYIFMEIAVEAAERPNEYFDIVKLLPASGANTRVVDKQGMTALKPARLNESADLVKLLRATAK